MKPKKKCHSEQSLRTSFPLRKYVSSRDLVQRQLSVVDISNEHFVPAFHFLHECNCSLHIITTEFVSAETKHFFYLLEKYHTCAEKINTSVW